MKSLRWVGLFLALGTVSPAFAGLLVLRTPSDGDSIETSVSKMVYRRVCVTEQQYGVDPSCGIDRICGWKNVKEQVKRPDGTFVWVETRRWVCREETRACFHPVTACRDDFDHTVTINVRIRFDERAKLMSWENETLEVSVDGLYESKRVEIRAPGSRFSYAGGSESFLAFGSEASLTFDLVTIDAKRVTPVNDVELVDARIIGRDAVEVIVVDPLANAPEISSNQLKIKLVDRFFLGSIFGDTYIEGIVEESSMERLADGRLKLVVKAGMPQWKKSPHPDKGDKYMLYYEVRRASPAHNSNFSGERGTLIKITK